MKEGFIIKGQIVFSENMNRLSVIENGYAVCENGICKGVFIEIPKEFSTYKIIDYKDCIIIPGMVDLHVHAPQYSFRGLAMDLELIEWLNTNTFPEEEKYRDIAYAEKAYKIFVEDLKNSETTRACIFSTIHREATVLLMELLEASGLNSYVGKVNMDRNCNENLCEDTERSIDETEQWIAQAVDRFKNTKPILTPRFVPSCSDKLMNKLGNIQKKFNLPVQSHLSENISEILWVKSLNKKSSCYGDAYNMFGLFGENNSKAIMAHCVYSNQEELELIKKNNVFVAHCPESNINLASGIAPIRKYLDYGVNVGLGSDVAAGSTLSMMKAITYAIQASKMYYRLVNNAEKPITFEETFYLATVGGGSFFGKVGAFINGYEFDAVVLDDSKLKNAKQLSVRERLERCIYDNTKLDIVSKYVAGNRIL